MTDAFVLNDDARLVGSTEGASAHFFGYHDVSPWDPANRQLITHRLPAGVKDYTGSAVAAEVCLWDPVGGDIRTVANTTAWSWEQASRAQWRGDSKALVYNALDDDGHAMAVELDVSSGESRPLPCSVYAISRDGNWGLTPHFGRLWRYWKSYGYDCRLPSSIDETAPGDDGIYLLDIATGEVRLVVSVRQAVETDPVPVPADTPHFLAHPTFAPSGDKFAFLHRFASKDRALFTRLFVCDRDGGNAHVLAREEVSHFEWLNDHQLIVWARQAAPLLTGARSRGITALPLVRSAVRALRRLSPGIKQRMLNEYYFLYDLRRDAPPKRFGADVLDQDGHPQVAPTGDWIITDTYADASGYQTLILFNHQLGRRVDVGRFALPGSFTAQSLKSDLHPRWDRHGTLICIDSAHSGERQMYVLDVSKLIH